MSPVIEVRVPDIGDFENVEVIEVLVSPGDAVEREDSLITIESDKASMEIPSPRRGVVREVCVELGSRVSEGTLVLRLEEESSVRPTSADSVAGQVESVGAAQGATSPAPAAEISRSVTPSDLHADVLVLGGGPGGYTARSGRPISDCRSR